MGIYGGRRVVRFSDSSGLGSGRRTLTEMPKLRDETPGVILGVFM